MIHICASSLHTGVVRSTAHSKVRDQEELQGVQGGFFVLLAMCVWVVV